MVNRRNVALLMLLMSCFGMVWSCSKSGSTAGSNHPALGHWQGTLMTDDGRQNYGALLVEDNGTTVDVGLTFLPIGAYYSECVDIQFLENALTFNYQRAKFDLVFDAQLSADGNELSGTIVENPGSKSDKMGGSFHFVRTPRVQDLPNAMTFSQKMQGVDRQYSLIITLGETDDGRWVGQVDMPEFSINEMTMFNMSEEDGVIRGIIVVSGTMNFELTISDDQQRLTGTWSTGRDVTELDLSRVN